MNEITLGQKIFKTNIDMNLVDRINFITDKMIEENKISSAVPYLSGKIKNVYNANNILRQADKNKQIGKLIEQAVQKSNVDSAFDLLYIKLFSSWINDQKQNEYQVVHQHSGSLLTGFSLILFLKVPDFGSEFTNTILPTNGRTEIISNGGGLFGTSHYLIDPRVGDVYIFPYDMKHLVYPFKGNDIRRSLSCNFDLYLKKK